MGQTDVVAPVAATDRDDGELGNADGGADGTGNLLAALDTEADVAVVVTDDDECFEASALAGRSLLLHRGDLHDLVLEVGEEVVHDLVFLDGHAEEVELLQAADAALLDQAANLGHRGPLLLVVATTARTTSTATAAITTTAPAKTTTATPATLTGFCVSHLVY